MESESAVSILDFVLQRQRYRPFAARPRWKGISGTESFPSKLPESYRCAPVGLQNQPRRRAGIEPSQNKACHSQRTMNLRHDFFDKDAHILGALSPSKDTSGLQSRRIEQAQPTCLIGQGDITSAQRLAYPWSEPREKDDQGGRPSGMGCFHGYRGRSSEDLASSQDVSLPLTMLSNTVSQPRAPALADSGNRISPCDFGVQSDRPNEPGRRKKAGGSKEVTITSPDDYPRVHLKGRASSSEPNRQHQVVRGTQLLSQPILDLRGEVQTHWPQKSCAKQPPNAQQKNSMDHCGCKPNSTNGSDLRSSHDEGHSSGIRMPAAVRYDGCEVGKAVRRGPEMQVSTLKSFTARKRVRSIQSGSYEPLRNDHSFWKRELSLDTECAMFAFLARHPNSSILEDLDQDFQQRTSEAAVSRRSPISASLDRSNYEAHGGVILEKFRHILKDINAIRLERETSYRQYKKMLWNRQQAMVRKDYIIGESLKAMSLKGMDVVPGSVV